jgi:putative ABC transport system permease protein
VGASNGHVLRMVIGSGLSLTVFGVVFGLLGALALTRVLKSMLFGIQPTDPLTIVGVLILLIVVALVAIFLPAYRATRIDPLQALRYE